MRYSDDIIEEVRTKNDIVDVISQYVKLQRKGTVVYSDTGDSVKTYGSGGFKKSYTKSSGTYRLYFSSTALSESEIPSFNINGTVKR